MSTAPIPQGFFRILQDSSQLTFHFLAWHGACLLRGQNMSLRVLKQPGRIDVSVPEQQKCPHCGLDGYGNSAFAPFCCIGCQSAAQLISSMGLDSYYSIRGAKSVSVSISDDGQVPSEKPWLSLALESSESQDGLTHLSLDIQGIHCAACVWVIQQLFDRQQGAFKVEINPSLGQMEMHFGRSDFDLDGFLSQIAALGYRVGPRSQEAVSDDGHLLLRFGVAGAIAMNGMVFSISSYVGLTESLDPLLFQVFSWLNLALSTLSVVIGGPVFFRSAFQGLRRGLLHLDLPISLGILVAYFGSVFSFFQSPGREAYFDTLQIFVAFMLLGRLLQHRLVERNRRMLLADTGIAGFLVRKISGAGRVEVVAAAELRSGDHIIVAVGEILPLAAKAGPMGSNLSLDWINGESESQYYGPGARIPAGARNAGPTALEVQAIEDFSSSFLRQLLMSKGSLQESQGPLRGPFWGRFSTFYVLSVLVLALAAFAFWLPNGMAQAINVAVAVLVVTCPCALGLAIPLAYELAHTALQKHGLFVRRHSFLDRVIDVKKILFDKTGTLTLGVPRVEEPEKLLSLKSKDLLVLRHMVSHSNHPKSKGIFALLHPVACHGSDLGKDQVVTETAGLGLSCTVEGRLYRLEKSIEKGLLVFQVDGLALAAISFSECLNNDALFEVQNLKALGQSIYVLSGDEDGRVHQVARHLNIPHQHVLSQQSPEEKRAFVEALDHQDTLMIGDGVNDALAFEAAYCTGTPCTEQAMIPARSDFFYLGAGLGPISKVFVAAQTLRRVVIRNLVFATLYNVLAVSFAFAGLVTPLFCAIAMPLSSVFVIASTSFSLSHIFHSESDENYALGLREAGVLGSP